MLIIGIGGGTGSGKTKVVNQIISEFPKGEVQVISQDSYYNDTSHLNYQDRCKINFDHPKSIDFKLLETHLKDLKQGKSVKQPIYSFKTHNRTGNTALTKPKKVIIVEGILILSDTQLRNIFDIKIFVHADSDERLMRRIKRDLAERGRDLDEVLDRYKQRLNLCTNNSLNQ